ncbi:NfeD family protein [Bosea sp. 117]|uniref:NfeD family protein n=1 Tax=Bosea sp. 117 TaxID=1125973 RepID=UPI0004944F9F|nr:NfeD family protein [Bosea sp. 117]
MSIIETLGPWSWFILAGLLMIGELAAPGAYLLWLGLAAAACGAVGFLVDLPWQAEILLFAVLALAMVALGRWVTPRPSEGSDRPFLNRRAEGYVGRSFVLDEPIVGGVGRVRIDDTVWRIVGADQPAGSRVVVQRVDGATLVVAAA